MRGHTVRIVVSSFFAIAFFGGTAAAQHTYEVLHSFVEPAYPPKGRLLEASNGRLYGVARDAGAFTRGVVLATIANPMGRLPRR